MDSNMSCYPSGQTLRKSDLRSISALSISLNERTTCTRYRDTTGHRILRRNPDEHVDMVLHHMPFQDGAPPLPGQLTQHRPKKAPDLAIQRFLPSLRDKDHVIFTIPLCVA